MAAFYVNPSVREVAITASANTIECTTGGFYANSDSTVTYVTVGGSTVTKDVLAGSYHPVQIVKLTAGTGIIGMYQH
jgi:hypothetical protein